VHSTQTIPDERPHDEHSLEDSDSLLIVVVRIGFTGLPFPVESMEDNLADNRATQKKRRLLGRLMLNNQLVRVNPLPIAPAVKPQIRVCFQVDFFFFNKIFL
jgi:hypothetical protein